MGMDIPDELDLISVFESIPKRKDETDIFYYDQSTFLLETDNEVYEIILSPFYHEFSMSIKEKKTDEELSHLELLSVNKIEIVKDSKDYSKIRLFHGESDRYENIIEITFKPRFKLIFREQYR
ncbi:hypothetical protein [Fictibacillus sp. BK138]|uniref:hypothetical protein n=1 Tax=Fictibacillus sp. BK138 TaxID=2512121 RepID=UPI001028E248|nr:hypothetical protein [Fictibacillus sp. BK138]RZT21627.1 hypothetical protein EV282_0690 [Fictibacillus sp. BK138]